jgi:transketolase
VISVPSWELFDKQDDAYKQKILAAKAQYQISVEAGRGLGWQKFVGRHGLIISQETYGASAPEPVMIDHFGFTGEKVFLKIKEFITHRENNGQK